MKKDFAVIDYCVELYKEHCSTSAIGFQNYRNLIHPAGFTGCMVNHEIKTVFMHIDKCASRSVTAALKELDFSLITENKNFILDDSYKIFAITRDPNTRWPAGLNEYMYRYIGPECDDDNPMFGISVPKEMLLSLEEIEEQIKHGKLIFEDHTAPQYLFLKPCEGKPIKFFNMDENLEKKLRDYLGLDISVPYYNVSKDKRPYYKSFCNDMFEKYVKDSVAFQKVYEKDFGIFKSSE